MRELRFDSKGKKKSKGSAGMYDLTLDRRVSDGRRDMQHQPLDGMQYFDRRNNDRRMDNRPLIEFPFLPEVIL